MTKRGYGCGDFQFITFQGDVAHLLNFSSLPEKTLILFCGFKISPYICNQIQISAEAHTINDIITSLAETLTACRHRQG